MNRGLPEGVRQILYAVLAMAALPAGAQTQDPYAGLSDSQLDGIRSAFYRAADSMEATMGAIRSMEAELDGPAASWPLVARAYRASLEGLIGKHHPSLMEKFRRVNASLDAWRGLVEAAPLSLELRFLRYSFFLQLPGIFGVGSYLEPDRKALLELLEAKADARVPPGQRRDMIEWLLKEGKLPARDRQRLERVLADS